MGSRVMCDACNKRGYRRFGGEAPDGWLYGSTPLIDDDGKVEDTIYIYACTRECAAAFWRAGPGRLDLTEPPFSGAPTWQAQTDAEKETLRKNFVTLEKS